MSWQADAIQRLNKMTVEHAAFKDHVRGVVSFLELPRGPEFLVVTGATQVGKSKIVKTSEALFLRRLKPAPDDMPVVKIVSDNSSTNGFFSTKAFMFSACRAVRHPFFDGEDDDGWGGQMRIPERVSESTLRDAFLQGLRHRKSMVLVLDELQQVLHCKGGRPAALRVLDSLKGLALNAGIPVIMIGSYELLQLVQEIPHLLSRTTCIHVAPYMVDRDEDQSELFGVLSRFIDGCPLDKKQGAKSAIAEYVIPRSLGAVGHLSRWVTKAVREAMRVESPVLSVSHFVASRIGPRGTARFLHEIRMGRELLGLDLKADGKAAPAPAKEPGAGAPKKRKACRARPHRHPIVEHGAEGTTP